MSPPGNTAGILLRRVDALRGLYAGGAHKDFWLGEKKGGRWVVHKSYTEAAVLPELDLRWLQQQALDHLDDEQAELNALGILAAGVIQAVHRCGTLAEMREAAGHEVESSDGTMTASVPDLLGDRRIGRLLVGIPVLRPSATDALYLEVGGWMRWKGAEVLRLSDAQVTADYTAAAVKEGLVDALQTRADSLLSRVTDVVRIRRALGSMKFEAQ